MRKDGKPSTVQGVMHDLWFRCRSLGEFAGSARHGSLYQEQKRFVHSAYDTADNSKQYDVQNLHLHRVL